jgi:CHAT domain-containing protein/tetratricopeptide (TPR) repeat protein
MLDVSRTDVGLFLLLGLVLACLIGAQRPQRGASATAGQERQTARDTSALHRRADSVLTIADSLRKEREVASAMRRYRQALALYRQIGNREGQADARNEIGILHAYQDRRGQALAELREALRLYRALGRREEAARGLNNIAIIHKRAGDYDAALRTYREALQVFRELGDKKSRAVVLSNMALVHEKQGEYGKGLTMHEKALRTYRALGNRAGIARSLDNIGDVQVRQGQYLEALANFREALHLHEDLGNKRRAAGAHNGIGRVQFWRYQYDDALSHLRTAVEMHREVGDRSAVAGNLNDIGLIYQKQGKYAEAEAVLRKVLRVHRDIDDRYSTATTLQALGEVERGRKNYEEALRRYRNALRINRKLGHSAGVAQNLDGIGNVRLAQGRFAAADSILRRSVRVTEELLQTASGPERRDFLAKGVDRFHALVTTQVRAGRPRAALRTLERSRARVLTKQLSEDVSASSTPSVPPVDALQQTLASNEAALLYANTDTERPITAFVVTRQSVQVREIPDSTVLRTTRTRYESALGRLRLREELVMSPAQGASLLRQAKGVKVGVGTEGTLANLIRLYRHDLSVRPETATLSSERRRRLGQVLYDLLVEPLEEEVVGKEELVVVPDGALGYLPFESLSTWDGERLVDRWRVRYVQSLRTQHLLQARGRPPSGRGSLLAVGGAVYDSTTHEQNASTGSPASVLAGASSAPSGGRMKDALVRDEAAREEGYRRLARGDDPLQGYRRLGFGPDRWTNLPGTRREVQALGRIATPSTLLVGTKASERTIRRLSETGRLREHRVIHFATHGFVVPRQPAFSALVLSDVGRRTPSSSAPADSASSDSGGALSGRVDGYLNMREIAKLDLRAEFVALSACRTGMGRIYRGSGAVSLTQAFLRAGAASVAVSLWSVYDASTSRFMEAVYRRAWSREASWAEALAQTKRAFATGHHGERLQAPRFWAPFVYYGWDAGAGSGSGEDVAR